MVIYIFLSNAKTLNNLGTSIIHLNDNKHIRPTCITRNDHKTLSFMDVIIDMSSLRLKGPEYFPETLQESTQ